MKLQQNQQMMFVQLSIIFLSVKSSQYWDNAYIGSIYVCLHVV